MSDEQRSGGTAEGGDGKGYRMIGPYRLVQKLGQGGMGVVHLALDPQGRAVAIKVLHPHIAYDDDARERLAREVRTLTRVRHAGVAAVLDADTEGDSPYVVTEYVPGPPLDAVVKEKGPFTGESLFKLARGLADALEAIHRSGVVHRDLKPANVLMEDDHPVLIDFGIAHVADDTRLTSTGLVMGTPGYLSPEVVEGAPVTPATDWWGWAATLAFAASGQPPFGRGPMAVVLDRVTRGNPDLSRVDPRLAPMLAAALSPRTNERPPARELLQALDAFARGQDTSEFMPRMPQQTVLPPPLRPPGGQGPGPGQHAPSGAGAAAYRPQQRPVTGPQQRPTAPTPVQPVAARPMVATRPDERVVTDTQGGSYVPGPAYAAAPVDPRIGRPRHSLALTGLVAALAGLAAVAPVLAFVAYLVWGVVARTSDKVITSMVLRRYDRGGPRPGDRARGIVLSPVHLVSAVLATLGCAVLPFVVAVAATYGTSLAMFAAAESGQPEPSAPVPLAVGAALGMLTTWFGVGGISLRRGSRTVVRTFVPSAALGPVAAAVALAVGVVCFVLAHNHGGAVAWWPFDGAPDLPLIPDMPKLKR